MRCDYSSLQISADRGTESLGVVRGRGNLGALMRFDRGQKPLAASSAVQISGVERRKIVAPI
jgi:hypothetical protein